MKRLASSEIKAIIRGIALTDASVDARNSRLEFYSKYPEYSQYIAGVLQQAGLFVRTKVTTHKKSGHVGYRVWTRKSAYLKNIFRELWDTRKFLSRSMAKKLTPLALAHMWMSDGYLEHPKNRRTNKVQNVGWWCLEAFPKEELENFQARLLDFGIASSLVRKPWGYGYRVRVGGENLQKMISLMYPHILPVFQYKTILFYKKRESANLLLPSAEQYIVEYDDIEDIVRHPLKSGQPFGSNLFLHSAPAC